MSTSGDTAISAELSARIRVQLAAGTLPIRNENQMICAGYGDEQRCDCCGLPVRPGDVLYEVELPAVASQKKLAMHLGCFDAWAAESRRLRNSQPIGR